jgi:hypothetical protein
MEQIVFESVYKSFKVRVIQKYPLNDRTLAPMFWGETETHEGHPIMCFGPYLQIEEAKISIMNKTYNQGM